MNKKQLILLFSFLNFIACRVPLQDAVLSSGSKNETFTNFPSITQGPKHQVMVLGTFHFNRSTDGSDVISKNQIDISSIQNQNEIDSLLHVLQIYKPDKICLEWLPKDQPEIDSLYDNYLQGKWEPGKNESFQIGFKLAKLLNHAHVYCIDNRPKMPETVSEIDDWDDYALSLNQMDLLHKYDIENDRFNGFMDSLKSEWNVLNFLKLLNSETHSKRSKQLWFTGLVNLGVYDKYVGADLTGHWYRRNTRIFVNASNLIEKENERILIIYGASHKWILDELFEASPEFEVKQLNDLLKYNKI